MTLCRRAPPLRDVCKRRVSATCSPTVCTGFKADMAFWKIIATRSPRTVCISASGSSNRSKPATRTSPPVIPRAVGNRRIAAREVTDLPLPDSPTSANISPAFNSKLTPLSMVSPVSSAFTLRFCTCITTVDRPVMREPPLIRYADQKHHAPSPQTDWLPALVQT